MDQRPAEPPSPDDPRLAIPEILREGPAGAARAPEGRPEGSDIAQMARAWAVALDFVFTIIAGGVVGWLFDLWRKSGPIGLLVGLGLGFVLAFVRIIRATQKQERLEAARKKGAQRRY